MGNIWPVKGLCNFGGTFTVRVGVKVVGGDTAHASHDSLISQVVVKPEVGKEQQDTKSHEVVVVNINLSLKIRTLKVWPDIQVTVQCDKVHEGSNCNHEFQAEEDETNDQNSLGGDEEVGGSVNNSNGLLK